MKILAFGDNHGDLSAYPSLIEKSKKCDIVICIGDLTFFEQQLTEMVEQLRLFEKPVLLIHGNHERASSLRKLSRDNIQFSHEEVLKVNEYNFITYGGDGFSRIDEEFEQFVSIAKHQVQMEKTILVLHGPPAGTKLDIPFENYHSGNQSTRKFIEENQPLLVLAGHIHECNGEHDKIKKTILINPGPKGEVIDVDALRAQRFK